MTVQKFLLSAGPRNRAYYAQPANALCNELPERYILLADHMESSVFLMKSLEAEQFVLGSVLLDDTLFPQGSVIRGGRRACDFNVAKPADVAISTCRMVPICSARGERIEYLHARQT